MQHQNNKSLIKKNHLNQPFRLGTTSYIIPEEIVGNIEFLKDVVEDIEIVLGESDLFSNIPEPNELEYYSKISKDHEISYTIHLPQEIQLGSVSSKQRLEGIELCKRVWDTFEPINPFAYILHFMPEQYGFIPARHVDVWLENIEKSVVQLLAAGLDPEKLCIETLSYNFSIIEPIIDAYSLGICLDIGHVWRFGLDYDHYMQNYAPRAKVIHLHGVKNGTDHVGIHVLEEQQIYAFFKELYTHCSNNLNTKVVTLEMFSQKDLHASFQIIDNFHKLNS